MFKFKKKKKNRKTNVYQIISDLQDIKGKNVLDLYRFWSPFLGDCNVSLGSNNTLLLKRKGETTVQLNRYGYKNDDFGECMVFPSATQRDWEDFRQKMQIPPEPLKKRCKKSREQRKITSSIHVGEIVENGNDGAHGIVLYLTKDFFGKKVTGAAVVTPTSNKIEVWETLCRVSNDVKKNVRSALVKKCTYDDLLANLLRIYVPIFLCDIREEDMFQPFEAVLTACFINGAYRWVPSIYAFYNPEKNKHVLMQASFKQNLSSHSDEGSSFTLLDKNIPIIKYHRFMIYQKITDFSPTKINEQIRDNSR